MEQAPVFFDATQFGSENFSTSLHPAQFLLFLLKRMGKNVLVNVDHIIVQRDEFIERPEEAVPVVLRISNGTATTGDFLGTYYRSYTGVHYLSYRRSPHPDDAFATFTSIYDSGDDAALNDFIKKQIKTATIDQPVVLSNNTVLDDFLESNLRTYPVTFSHAEKQKMLAFNRHSKKHPYTTPQQFRQLLKELLYIEPNVDFVNATREHNYHPGGKGLGEPDYAVGKIVLDSIVQYRDVSANIEYQFKNGRRLDFRPKVDYIHTFRLPANILRQYNPEYKGVKDIDLIPLVNTRTGNYASYRSNGLDLYFASCIFAYQVQTVYGKIELLVKFRNSDCYTAIDVAEGKPVTLTEHVYYDEFAQVVSKNHLICGKHTVTIKMFLCDDVIRIETQEFMIIDLEDSFKKMIAAGLTHKIKILHDLFLPVVYEQKIDLY